MLPDPGWPGDRVAPGEVELVRRFLNTTNRENGADRLRTVAGLDRWLAGEGRGRVGATRAELDRLIELRELLHAITTAHTSGEPTRDLMARLAESVQNLAFVVDAGQSGLAIRPAGSRRFDVLLGDLALAVVDAERDGTWRRLKACSHCHWVVYDASKNASGRWCSMTACGGREKAREYRRRRHG